MTRNRNAVALGSLGGKARAKKLSKQRPIYYMIVIPNSRSCPRLSSRDHAGQGAGLPKGKFHA